ncbi:MAG: DNA-binding response regulator [Sphingobacteriales bacterium]|nr:MAG: DNA-binding response regulator [Sphingobacteriales bacterium]
MNILIIEDEKLTARDLQKAILSVRPYAQIVGMVASVEEGITFFSTPKNIDLVFSDIQLGDGLSFEIFEHTQTQLPVIFCTAYDEYALKAFKTFGIDYILKPFSTNAITRAFDKFEKLSSPNKSNPTNDYSKIFEVIKQQLIPNKTSSILVYRNDKIVPIEADTIALLYIENETVYALTFEQKTVHTNYKLDVLEQKLSPHFFRANRQFLINRKAVKEASQHFHRKLQIHLTIPFAETILVGKEKGTSFLYWLTN